MIQVEEMAEGLAALGMAFGKKITEPLAHVYHGVLGARITHDEWQRAVRTALDRERFWPAPATLLGYALPARPSSARAADIEAQIQGLYESGRCLTPRSVSEEFGDAARDAFVAAGGDAAFSWCEPENRPFRLKRFVDAYQEAVESDPTLSDGSRRIESRREAAQVMSHLRERMLESIGGSEASFAGDSEAERAKAEGRLPL